MTTIDPSRAMTTTNITSLTLNISTSVDGRNGVNLEIGYYSTHGGVPLFQTLTLHPAGTYIGSSLQVSLDSSKLPADINTIFSLRIITDTSSPAWTPNAVVSCQAGDSGGGSTDLCTNVVLKVSTVTFYSNKPPRPGVRGFIYDTSQDAQGGTPMAVDVKAGQTLTIRVDPNQQWSMGGVPCNCNGPIHDFDAPYLTMNGWAGNYQIPYTLKRGTLVIIRPAGVRNDNYWMGVTPVGNYLRMSVVADGRVLWKVWDNALANNKGKIGIEIEVSDFDFNEYAAAPPPAGASSVVIKPQTNYWGNNNAPKLLDTGLDLKLGDVLHARCDPYDTWVITASSNLAVNANGVFSPTSGETNPRSVGYRAPASAAYYAKGSLVGTLDDGKTQFGVGTWLDLTVAQAGRLKLVCWDDTPGDDTGEITAKLWTSPAPYLPAGGGGAPPSSTTVGDIALTINDGGGPLMENIELTNTGSGDVDLKGFTVQISTARPIVGWYTFAASTVVKPGASVKVWVGAKPGEAHSINSATPMLYGAGKDRASLIQVIKDVQN